MQQRMVCVELKKKNVMFKSASNYNNAGFLIKIKKKIIIRAYRGDKIVYLIELMKNVIKLLFRSKLQC